MASILLIGRDDALLEGLAQMLAHAGHAPHTAHTALEAVEIAAAEHPLVERHRLITLVQRVEERLRATGRGEDRSPDHRAS